jgi:hypothetical protein
MTDTPGPESRPPGRWAFFTFTGFVALLEDANPPPPAYVATKRQLPFAFGLNL